MTLTPAEAKLLKETYPNIDAGVLALNGVSVPLPGAPVAEKPNKYHVSPAADRTYNGILYDSKKEMRYYVEVLEPLLKAGELDYVLYHVRFPVGNDPVTIYEADYVTLKDWTDHDTGADRLAAWQIEVIEVKGCWTATARKKIKLFRQKYPLLKLVIIS